MIRLYDPSSGGIYVDGINLTELNIGSYHKFIAVVNQNPLLFNSSIGENIAYGAPEKIVTDKGTEFTGWSNISNDHPSKFITLILPKYSHP